MATTISYGSISIIDVTDIGEFSVYPKCNLPLSVIYNPDQSGTTAYTPNWGTTNLEITPSVWYAGELISNTATGLTITWTRQEGVGNITALTTNETVSNGILTVNANKFTENIPMISYIVTATYLEPTSNQRLTAQGEITFSLIKQASTTKTISITGDSIFKYNSSGSIVGASSITLTARYTNVSLGGWQYQSGNNWVTYPNSTVGTTLTVNDTDNVFTGDKAVIRLVAASPDSTVYDLHTITKLYDGATGQGTITAILTNEDQMIPFNAQGVGTYTSATSRIIIYEGGVGDVTSQYTIIQTLSNVQATASRTTVDNDTVQITSLLADTGSVNFSAVLTADPTSVPLVKTFSLVKVQQGEDGVSPVLYSLEADAYAMSKTHDNVFTPQSITFYCWQQEGTTKTPYTGMLKIYENIKASDITSNTQAAYSSSQGESSHIYTPSTSATLIVAVMYKNGAFNDVLDTQSVAIALQGIQGIQGEDGDNGEDAYNIIVGNSYEGIPTNSNSIITADYTVTIPFAGYKGTNKVATSTSGTLPTLLGITGTVSAATTSSDGSIVYMIPAGTNISSFGNGGVLTFTFLIDNTATFTYDFSWGKNKSAKDGENVVILQLMTPLGNIIENSTGNITIQATLNDGSIDVSTNQTASYKWYKFSSSSSSADGYDLIANETSRTLTVTPTMVEGYASFKCVASYNSVTDGYVQYMAVMDKSDPIQVSVFSSVGDKLINGMGVGALYVKIYRKGEELDPIKSERFYEELPTTGNKNGDFAYLLDSTNKTVTLQEYQNGWSNYSYTYSAIYDWFYRDKDGNRITVGVPSSSGKVIYIDGSLVDKKLIADVRVTV